MNRGCHENDSLADGYKVVKKSAKELLAIVESAEAEEPHAQKVEWKFSTNFMPVQQHLRERRAFSSKNTAFLALFYRRSGRATA